MTGPSTAKGRFLAALVVAIAGSAPEADVAPELGGSEAAARLETAVTQARQQRGNQ